MALAGIDGGGVVVVLVGGSDEIVAPSTGSVAVQATSSAEAAIHRTIRIEEVYAADRAEVPAVE